MKPNCMKTTVLSALLLLFTIVNTHAQVVTYAPTEGVPQKNDFKVCIIQNGKSFSSPTYQVAVDRVLNARHQVEQASMTQFSFGGEIRIRLEYTREKIDSVRIRPSSLGIKPEVKGQNIEFTLAHPTQLSVEVNGDIYHNLHLFANPLEKMDRQINKMARSFKPKFQSYATGKGLIYFPAGIHDLSKNKAPLRIPSNTTVYIAGGAWIKGQLSIDSVENVRVVGRGIIDCNQRAGLYISHSRNISVEGIILSQCPVGNSSKVNIENVKVISAFGWGDGFNVFAADSVSYNHCFARTSDDCTTVYATRKGFVGGASHIHMQNSTLWADVAHPIFIGLHGNVERPDTIENLLYENIDILGQREFQTDYQGCLAIGAGDLNVVRNVTFRNIRVENIEEGQLINIRTTFNQKYCKAPGQLVENITFENISYQGSRPNLSIMAAFDESHPIRNICFRNLNINGKHIYDSMAEKPKWYKTSDFANMYVGENVYNVTFE